MKNSTAKRWFILLALLLIVATIVGLLTGCEAFEPPPEPPEETWTEHCLSVENFEFYEATRDTLLGDGKEWRLITPHGDLKITDATYNEASTFHYARICYDESDLTSEIKYAYSAQATTVPEPEIVEVEIEVPVEVPVYTHSVIDEDFIAEDGVFYYYIGEDIVNLHYKQGLEIFIFNILYDKKLINQDEYVIYATTYINGTHQDVIVQGLNDWEPAEFTMPDDTVVEFNNIEELLQFLALHYSFNEIKADWIALTDGDPSTTEQGIWAEENATE